VHNEHVLIANRTADFAYAVKRLLSDAALRARLSEKGPELAEQYSWESIEEKVRELVSATMLAARDSLHVQLGSNRVTHLPGREASQAHFHDASEV
jgi:hypothetical protein